MEDGKVCELEKSRRDFLISPALRQPKLPYSSTLNPEPMHLAIRAFAAPARQSCLVFRRGFASSSGKTGFIGLGQMGSKMAANLVKAGEDVVVFDMYPPAVEAATNLGASSASKVSELAKQCSVIVTMLPSSKQVDNTLLPFPPLPCALTRLKHLAVNLIR
jgi:hypothetical protein